MIHFECDYLEGAVPEILSRMAATNMDQTVGYGCDEVCESARTRIRQACGLAGDAPVYFLVGGTQANTTVIASILRPYQGALSPATGHINVHETGAIEGTGHKVIAIPASSEGKITAEQVRQRLAAHFEDETAEHMVEPGLLYLSNPTEFGTLYSRSELLAIRQACHERGIPLYIDGARLGYGLMARGCDLTLEDIARIADVFYIGGTKQGALMGEAVVFADKSLAKGFASMIKRQGGRFAKGRLLGLQFDVLFSDGLYWKYARHAIEEAMRIREAFAAKGIAPAVDSPTNQQFFRLTAAQRAALAPKYGFEGWGVPAADGTQIVRFCTSWATRPEAVEALSRDIARL